MCVSLMQHQGTSIQARHAKGVQKTEIENIEDTTLRVSISYVSLFRI